MPPGRLTPEIKSLAPKPFDIDEPAPTPFPPTLVSQMVTYYFVMGALIL